MADLSALPKRHPGARFRLIVALAGALSVCCVAACGQTHPPRLNSAPSTAGTAPASAAVRLAALATTALDNKYAAAYTYRVRGRSDRTVVVTVATDRSWSVYVPGGALGGGGDISIVGTAGGLFQCLLGGPLTTAAQPTLPADPASPSPTSPALAVATSSADPSPTPSAGSASPDVTPPSSPLASPTPAGPVYVAPACVPISTVPKALLGTGFTLPAKYVPPVVHAFTDWLSVLSDRSSAILVFTAKAPATSAGTCFSVEPSATSIAPVIEAGIFCFRDDGTLTSVTLSDSSLALQGSPAPPPPSDGLPAPQITGAASPLTAPR